MQANGQPINGQHYQPLGGQHGQPTGGQYGQPFGGQRYQSIGGQHGQPIGGQQYQTFGGQQFQPIGGQQFQPIGGQHYQPIGGQYGGPIFEQYGQPIGGQYGQQIGGQNSQPTNEEKRQQRVEKQDQPIGGENREQKVEQHDQPKRVEDDTDIDEKYNQRINSLIGQQNPDHNDQKIVGHLGQQIIGQYTSMPPPMGMLADCPFGLESLLSLDEIIIEQQIEILEIVLDFECPNKYKLFNNVGMQCYYAFEESNTCSRQCCGPSRGFEMHILNNLGDPVFTVSRPFKVTTAMCNMGCQFDELTVVGSNGLVLGYVKQKCSLFRPHYHIFDYNGMVAFEIEGPFCTTSCCGRQVEFPVTAIGTGVTVAKISKHWGGFLREAFTDADTFGVRFPIDLDVKMKATLIGVVFLIDFMFFEEDAAKR